MASPVPQAKTSEVPLEGSGCAVRLPVGLVERDAKNPEGTRASRRAGAAPHHECFEVKAFGLFSASFSAPCQQRP